MKIRYTNKKSGKTTEMVVVREYKNWIGMDNDSYKVETF